jgi:hypothetical protein
VFGAVGFGTKVLFDPRNISRSRASFATRYTCRTVENSARNPEEPELPHPAAREPRQAKPRQSIVADVLDQMLVALENRDEVAPALLEQLRSLAAAGDMKRSETVAAALQAAEGHES